MAHFAQIDNNNIVTQVVVIDNKDTINETGIEVESIGVAFCKSLFGDTTNWVQTSYNGNMRKNYAGIGDTYDVDRDAFIEQQPYNSWVLNEEDCKWYPPISYPNDDNMYSWNEELINWELVE